MRTIRTKSASHWKIFRVAFLVFLSAPTFGEQYAWPRLEFSFGYGNVKLPHVSGFTSCGLFCGGFVEAAPGNHSGVVSQQTINLNRWFGVENSFGFYTARGDSSFSDRSTFFTDQLGGKLAARSLKRFVPVPFGVAGFGGSSLRTPGDLLTPSTSKAGIATRLGGGLEIPFKESMSLRMEYSRISSRFFGSWEKSTHLSAGAAFGFGQ